MSGDAPEARPTLEGVKTGGKLPSYTDVIGSAFDATEARFMAERLEFVQEKLRMKEAAEARKPGFWSKWLEPGPTLALAGMLGAAYLAYQNDRASVQESLRTMQTAIATMAGHIEAIDKAAQDRATKYVPTIERLALSADKQEMITNEHASRLDNIVHSVQDLRDSVGALRDAVQKQHEDIAIDRARREGRLILPQDDRGQKRGDTDNLSR